MKAIITRYGVIHITASNETEFYAARQWMEGERHAMLAYRTEEEDEVAQAEDEARSAEAEDDTPRMNAYADLCEDAEHTPAVPIIGVRHLQPGDVVLELETGTRGAVVANRVMMTKLIVRFDGKQASYTYPEALNALNWRGKL